MGKRADALRKLAEKPDDLTALPQIIADIEALEESESTGWTKVEELQTANKKFLQMMTVSTPKTTDPEPEPEKLTLNDLADELGKGVK